MQAPSHVAILPRMQGSASENRLRGTVVATYSREMDVVLEDRSTVRARIKGKKLKPVCADIVAVSPLPNEPEWLIEEILERRNELTRPNLRGVPEVLASNLDLVVVVAAPAPRADWYIVDRYLCAAELIGAEAAVVFNKIDLDATDAESVLQEYASIGYPTLRSSAETGQGLEQLAALLADRTSIVVGQSGVGKSSLINRLCGDAERRIGELTRATREGRHTTVNSVLLTLPNGARVIDSPGVRDYAPVIDELAEAGSGFREIFVASQQCRFANCRHMDEPDCGVKQAVEAGEVSQRRYDSYRRLIVMTEQLARRGRR